MTRHERKVEELAHGYELACANYCKYMLQRWNKEAVNDYIDEDAYYFTVDGSDFRLTIDEVRDVVNNDVPFVLVQAWNSEVQDERKDYMPLYSWVASKLTEHERSRNVK